MSTQQVNKKIVQMRTCTIPAQLYLMCTFDCFSVWLSGLVEVATPFLCQAQGDHIHQFKC